ncbi:MAG TPA: DUF6090 family protein [Flavobacteriaceae bacterium]|nr:DUF6090 family protein [Flavobacteriaceae bacterium]
MIKFFRKIRQNLLSEGKTGKYLKYAIGEIILVVIGILIALQLNNLNDSHKINKEENISLLKLHHEAESIVKSLKNDIAIKDSIIFSMNEVASFLHNKNIEEVSESTLQLGIEGIGYYKSLNLPNSVYNELFNSGKLQNIKSEVIQTSISNYYSNLEYLKGQLSYFRSSAQTLEIDFHNDTGFYVYDSTLPTKNKFKADIELLMNDKGFKSRQIHGLRNQIVFKRYMTDLLTSAQNMCNDLATELKIECTFNRTIS